MFIHLKGESGLLVNLNPVYDFLLTKKQAEKQDEYLLVEGFPLQFLLPYDDLSMEAFQNPNKITFHGMEFKIFGLEYLMAIMIQLGKRKYRERLLALLEDQNFDEQILTDILTKHRLIQKWTDFRRQRP